MYKLALIFLLVTMAFAANEQTGPLGGAGTQVLPAQSTSEKYENIHIFRKHIRNNVLMQAKLCDYSLMLGDPIVRCKIPLGVEKPPGASVEMKGQVLMKCAGKVIASSVSSLEYGAKSNQFYYSGSSFDFNGVRVISDERYAENKKKRVFTPFKTCPIKDFKIELVAFESQISGQIDPKEKTYKFEDSGLGQNNFNNASNDHRENIEADLLLGGSLNVYRYCEYRPKDFDAKRCKRATEEYNKTYNKTQKSNLELFLKEGNRILYEQDNERCTISPEATGCPQFLKHKEACDLNPSSPRCLNPIEASNAGGVRG